MAEAAKNDNLTEDVFPKIDNTGGGLRYATLSERSFSVIAINDEGTKYRIID